MPHLRAEKVQPPVNSWVERQHHHLCAQTVEPPGPRPRSRWPFLNPHTGGPPAGGRRPAASPRPPVWPH
eukprot:7657436-Lingulodinium_polyedra.AAC.1